MQISNIASFDMFLSVVSILLVVWVFATIMAHLVDELLWWATPTKLKVVIKHIAWNIAVVFAHVAVWKYNFHNRNYNRWSNWLTREIRANAEADMRVAIGHAENRLETLSLLLNGIQE